MTILKVRAKGDTRLEALHNLLSELETLKVDATYGTVLIEWLMAGITGGKTAYSAEWKY